MAGFGIALGLVLSLAVRQAMGALLPMVDFEFMTFAAISMALLTTALLAAAIPVRRAMRMSPLEVLRHD
jgi:ABC-type antimicrobial peptide transport system permease subunit